MNETEDVDRVQVGRILHFVVLDSCLPAIATCDSVDGKVSLQVFPNYPSENKYFKEIESHHTEMRSGTWHWPRECGKLNA